MSVSLILPAPQGRMISDPSQISTSGPRQEFELVLHRQGALTSLWLYAAPVQEMDNPWGVLANWFEPPAEDPNVVWVDMEDERVKRIVWQLTDAKVLAFAGHEYPQRASEGGLYEYTPYYFTP